MALEEWCTVPVRLSLLVVANYLRRVRHYEVIKTVNRLCVVRGCSNIGLTFSDRVDKHDGYRNPNET
jgi:hypothetical protein